MKIKKGILRALKIGCLKGGKKSGTEISKNNKRIDCFATHSEEWFTPTPKRSDEGCTVGKGVWPDRCGRSAAAPDPGSRPCWGHRALCDTQALQRTG